MYVDIENAGTTLGPNTMKLSKKMLTVMQLDHTDHSPEFEVHQ